MNLIFCMQISMKFPYKMILCFLMEMIKHSQSYQNSKFAMSLQYLEYEVRDVVDFLHANKHQSFLQVDFNTLSIKVFYKVLLSLLMDMIKHSQSTQSNKLVIALQLKLVALKLFNKILRKKVFKFSKIFQCRNCFCVLLWYNTF